jgi:hypothetical protein
MMTMLLLALSEFIVTNNPIHLGELMVPFIIIFLQLLEEITANQLVRLNDS